VLLSLLLLLSLFCLRVVMYIGVDVVDIDDVVVGCVVPNLVGVVWFDITWRYS